MLAAYSVGEMSARVFLAWHKNGYVMTATPLLANGMRYYIPSGVVNP